MFCLENIFEIATKRKIAKRKKRKHKEKKEKMQQETVYYLGTSVVSVIIRTELPMVKAIYMAK